MTLEEAKKHLTDLGWLRPDGAVYNLGTYISWDPKYDTRGACLDGEYFDADDLEAVAVYMRSFQ